MFTRTLVLAASALGLVNAVAVDQTFDYVIVGGGTAGLAVAARLSIGLPRSKILVIEAGPEALDEPTINIPGQRGVAVGGPFDWNLTTIAQPGLENRVITQPRGKVLGGSSALNFLTHNRASAAEFDGWESMGNPGWNWENMIEAMERAETFADINTQYYGSEGVGTSGPIDTEINRWVPAHQNSWIPTLNALGIPTNRESLGGDPNGVSWQPSTIDDAEHYVRSYSANQYIPQAGSNLKVWTDTLVSKVNLARSGRQQRATGVTLADGRVVHARAEVIVSAGAIHSPGILERSGIGRTDVLQRAGVRQVINLPGVGENFQDHLRLQTSFQLKDGILGFDKLIYNETYAGEQLTRWENGQLSHWDYTNTAFAFTNWKDTVNRATETRIKALASAANDGSPAQRIERQWLDNPDVPQVEVIMQDGYVGVKGYPAAGTPLFGKSFFTIVSCLMHPFSRGNVHISSSNPATNPTINPNYLSSEHDIQALVEEVKWARKIANTNPLRSRWVSEYEPGSQTATEAQIRKYVTSTTLPIYHPSGTTAMLPQRDGGVVNPRLVVYGTSNLRVIDAGIMPVIVSAHLTTAVYGIGERGAQLILEDAQ